MRGKVLVLLCILFVTIYFSDLAAALCDVDVYNLDVENRDITAHIKNTGNATEIINYTILVNSVFVESQEVELNSSEVFDISTSYNFDVGRYEVELKAVADCDSFDYESMVHYVLYPFECKNPHGIRGENRCDYDLRQYLVCRGGSWIVLARNNDGEYCYNCLYHCGDGSCNCGETYSSCYRDCRRSCTQEWICMDSYYKVYRYSDCSLGTSVYCPNGCRSGECISGSSVCDVGITTFDYVNRFPFGHEGYVTMNIMNTGSRTETINISFYLDGVLKNYRRFGVGAGDEKSQTFYYMPGDGSHQIKVIMETSCGTEERRDAYVNVFRISDDDFVICNDNGICEPEIGESVTNCPRDCAVIILPDTSVDINPSGMDMGINRGKVVSVYIVSHHPQTFTIHVTGVPESWMSYEKSIHVDEKDTVYIYITPKELGNYNMTVSVEAQDEGLVFSSDVALYVAPLSKSDIEDSLLGRFLKLIADFFGFLGSNLWALVTLLVIAFVTVIVVGMKKLRRGIFG